MKLLSPINYLRIRHEEKKWYDYIIPLIGGIIVTAVYYFFYNKIPLINQSGLIVQVNGLLQVLIGFYIAALAAVATFTNPKIDNLMAGDPPTLIEEFRGEPLEVKLTRRRFVSFLFGYLALASLMLFCVGLVSILVGKSVSTWVMISTSLSILVYIKTFFVFLYSFLLINIVTTTLLGLYYLSVRFHQSDE